MRTFSIYRARIGFYLGLAALLPAIPFSPLGKSYFMWLVVAPSIVMFLVGSLFFISLTYLQPSFRDPDEYRRTFGIPTTPLSWALGAFGTALMCTFPWALDNPPSIPLGVSEAGCVICLGVAHLALLRREARIHKRTQEERAS